MTQLSSQEFITVPAKVEAWILEPENLDLAAQWCRGRRRGLSVIFPKIRDKKKMLDAQDNNHYAIPGDVIVKTRAGFVKMSGEEFSRKFRATSTRIAL